ncbi:hypothetical protein KCU88_g7473, partial [Aureobasidium melanogenum]
MESCTANTISQTSYAILHDLGLQTSTIASGYVKLRQGVLIGSSDDTTWEKEVEIPVFLDSIESLRFCGFKKSAAATILSNFRNYYSPHGHPIEPFATSIYSLVEFALGFLEGKQDAFREDEDWLVALKDMGVKRSLREAICDPAFDDIRPTKSAKVDRRIKRNAPTIRSRMHRRTESGQSSSQIARTTSPSNDSALTNTSPTVISSEPTIPQKYKAGIFCKGGYISRFLDIKDTNIKCLNMPTLLSMPPGEFDDYRCALYLTKQGQVARRYANYAKARSPAVACGVLYISIPPELVENACYMTDEDFRDLERFASYDWLVGKTCGQCSEVISGLASKEQLEVLKTADGQEAVQWVVMRNAVWDQIALACYERTPTKAKATPTPTPTSTRTSTGKAKAKTTAATKKRTASEAGLDNDSGSEAAENDNDELATPSKKQKTPSRTPASRNSRTAFLKAVGDKNKKASTDTDSDRAAPVFVMPSIRKLCKTFGTPLLAPHVYTGTCIVLQLTGLWPQGKAQDTAAADGDHDYHDGHDNSDGGAGDAGDADTGSSFQESVTGLLIAIYLLTLTRMQTAKMTTSVYKATCSKSVQELAYGPGPEGVEAWIRRINREGYCRGQEWWASVPESVFDFEPNKRVLADADAVLDVDSGDEDDDEDRIISAAAATRRRHRATNEAEQEKNHDEDEEEQEDPPHILLPGLATMMQPAVDFTSDERTRDFDIWKRALLRKLDRLDKAASNTRRSTGRAVGARTGTATRTGRAKAVAVG